ncbi:hypothetical protein RBB75_20270 [Tunturibacter empetritectus]|uniref:Uncharacterized protein n=1 Tax=Tunturiibacter empetritectus TaxID=3069691 RepID=A0AAU7ZEF8_9BACT
MAKNPESNKDKEVLKQLQRLLKRSQGFLGKVNTLVTAAENKKLTSEVREDINTLWKDADDKLRRAQKNVGIGASLTTRHNLMNAGLYDKELTAKERLLEFCFDEKRFISALKLLQSIVGSLTKAFPILSAVKEFIDAVLTMRDWLNDPEMTRLDFN